MKLLHHHCCLSPASCVMDHTLLFSLHPCVCVLAQVGRLVAREVWADIGVDDGDWADLLHSVKVTEPCQLAVTVALPHVCPSLQELKMTAPPWQCLRPPGALLQVHSPRVCFLMFHQGCFVVGLVRLTCINTFLESVGLGLFCFSEGSMICCLWTALLFMDACGRVFHSWLPVGRPSALGHCCV